MLLKGGWFNLPPHPFNVRTLPWETLTPRKSQTQP